MMRALADPSQIRVIPKIVGVSAVIGVGFGIVLGEGGTRSAIQGAATGVFISLPIAWVELGLIRTRAGEQIAQSRFAIHVLTKASLYLVAVVAGILLSDALFSRSYVGPGFASRQFMIVVGAAFAVSLAISFTMALSAMLGPKVLASFITGRYHQPREERRVFLFVDMIGSTAAGERLGPIRFHLLLRRFIYDVGDAVAATRGEIHKYVGDEVIVTWPEDAALTGLPVACVGLIRDRIADHAEAYRREFGIVPEFWAAIHGGTIVAGELGGWKAEIAFIGDVVNTAARIAEACRTTGRHFLGSRQTIEGMRLPPRFRAEPLGPVALRGRTETVELVALERA